MSHVSRTDLQRTVERVLAEAQGPTSMTRATLVHEIMTAAERYAQCYRADVPLPPSPDVDESIITTIEAGHG